MNTIKFILTILRPIFRKGLQIAGRNYTHLLLTGGLIGLTTFLNHHNFVAHLTQSVSHVNPFHSKNENNNFFIDVTKQCASSVVAIEVQNIGRINPQTGQPMLASTGSGFVVQANGWILSNAHVIMNKPNSIIKVITTDGNSYEAIVTDIDLKLDLALLKINCNNLPPMLLAKSQNVTPGEWVLALGSPLSMKHTVTAGVVSSVSRDGRDLGMKNEAMKYIQTDAAITFGHSGGPLVNLDGEVIGVNNLRITSGIAFAIPVEFVKEFLKRSCMYSAENKKIQDSMNHPQFGVTTLPITPEIIDNLSKELKVFIPEQTTGILIWNVVKNSPAYKAGLCCGDIITHVNKKRVLNVAGLYNMLSKYEKELVTFTLYRHGIITEAQLKVEDKK